MQALLDLQLLRWGSSTSHVGGHAVLEAVSKGKAQELKDKMQSLRKLPFSDFFATVLDAACKMEAAASEAPPDDAAA